MAFDSSARPTCLEGLGYYQGQVVKEPVWGKLAVSRSVEDPGIFSHFFLGSTMSRSGRRFSDSPGTFTQLTNS